MITWEVEKFSRSKHCIDLSDSNKYPNEDRYVDRFEALDGVPSFFAGVIDGAAPLISPISETTPGELVAQTIRKTFMEVDPRSNLIDMLIEANRGVRSISQAHEVDFERPEALWAAAVSVVKINSLRLLKYVHIADTVILVISNDQEILLTQNQVEPFDRQVLVKMQEVRRNNNYDYQVQVKHARPMMIAQKALANSPDGHGYGAVNGMPDDQVRAYIQSGEIEITPDIEIIALMTDGLLPPPKWIGQERNWGQIAQILRSRGLKGLFKHTREIERSDPQLHHPRVKMHDDATGILIRIKQIPD